VILNVMEAATVRGLGRNTIRKLIKNNEPAHRRIGKRILIRRVDLDGFLIPKI